MGAGTAVVAIWNDVAAEGLAAFHAWHVGEHMAERVAIPGFRRGRRYAAADGATAPGFFTLYEVDDLGVLTGEAYTARLNAPTPATEATIPHFRNTVRSLATVAARRGHGAGGVLETIRLRSGSAAVLAPLVEAALARPRIVSATLCRTDDAASGIVTREKEGRTVLLEPPAWFLLIEATDAAALGAAVTGAMLADAGVADGEAVRGRYRLEQMLSEIDLTA